MVLFEKAFRPGLGLEQRKLFFGQTSEQLLGSAVFFAQTDAAG